MKHLAGAAVLALAFVHQAAGAACPAAGERFIIKGFTGDTPVTAAGGEPDARWGSCKFLVEDSDRELWWSMGEDVVPAAPASASGAAMPSTPAGEGGAPAPGNVYECTLPGIGLFTGAYFGIVDASTYRNYDGHTGSYEFDAASGVLHLTTGSSRGLRYQRQSPRNFRVLDEAGKITGGNCVLNTAKRIDGRW